MTTDAQPASLSHLHWFAREFRRGFVLDTAAPECGLRARTELTWGTGTKVWTDQIKTIVSRLALTDPIPFDVTDRPYDWAEGFAVSANPGLGRPDATGEFLFDVCWHTYRRSGAKACDYGACAATADRVGIELAFETEFGKQNSPDTSMSLVLDDFAKLREARARVKVMLYRHHAGRHDELRRMMVALADGHPVRLLPPDSFLLIGAPWDAWEWQPERRESLWTFHGRAGNGAWRDLDPAVATPSS